MHSTPHPRRATSKHVAGLFALATILLTAPLAQAGQTSWMRGGNWSDPRDNYVNGWIIPSGLSSDATVRKADGKAKDISSAVQSIGINVVRIAVNADTVLNNTWWQRYTAIVDRLVGNNIHVILCCWDGAGANKDGIIDNYGRWKSMWQKIDGQYGGNSNVWFEPFNEPFGYTAAELKTIYKDFLSFTGKSNDRVLLGGSGYSAFIGPIANDAAFNNCKFSLHIYTWFGNHTTEAEWKSELDSRLAGYQDRTLITEMGAPATTGLNYGVTSSVKQIAYIRGITQRCRELQMGFTYWPSHRDGDSYRLFQNTTDNTLTNESLKNRLRYGWGL